MVASETIRPPSEVRLAVVLEHQRAWDVIGLNGARARERSHDDAVFQRGGADLEGLEKFRGGCGCGCRFIHEVGLVEELVPVASGEYADARLAIASTIELDSYGSAGIRNSLPSGRM